VTTRRAPSTSPAPVPKTKKQTTRDRPARTGAKGTALLVAPGIEAPSRTAAFRVQLTIQPDGKVHHTEIASLHDNSTRDSWRDWDERHLIDCIRQASGLEGDQWDAERPIIEPSEELDISTVQAETADLDLCTRDDSTRLEMVDVADRCDVVVHLRLAKRPVKPLNVSVEVDAVDVGGNDRHRMASTTATTDGTSRLVVRMSVVLPPAGVYRLQGTMSVAEAAKPTDIRTTQLRGGTFLVRRAASLVGQSTR
jgi:hypothetical protein